MKNFWFLFANGRKIQNLRTESIRHIRSAYVRPYVCSGCFQHFIEWITPGRNSVEENGNFRVIWVRQEGFIILEMRSNYESPHSMFTHCTEWTQNGAPLKWDLRYFCIHRMTRSKQSFGDIEFPGKFRIVITSDKCKRNIRSNIRNWHTHQRRKHDKRWLRSHKLCSFLNILFCLLILASCSSHISMIIIISLATVCITWRRLRIVDNDAMSCTRIIMLAAAYFPAQHCVQMYLLKLQIEFLTVHGSQMGKSFIHSRQSKWRGHVQ